MADLTTGVYILTNIGSGSMMEVSLKYPKTVKGNAFSGNENQQWKFMAHGDGSFAIQSGLRGPNGIQLFLCPSDHGIRQNSPLTIGPHPVGWTVDKTDEGLVIRWPGTRYVVDLEEGRASPHTSINLCAFTDEERWRLGQRWSYTKCSFSAVDSTVPNLAVKAVTSASMLSMETTKWAPSCGPYSLRNVKGKTVLDLHWSDRRTVVCYFHSEHRDMNKKWEFVPSEDGHAIRSCLKGKDDENLFLTVEGPAKKGARAVGSPYPVTWHIRLAYPPTTEIAFRYPIKVLWPKSTLVLSLGNDGSSADETQVELDEDNPCPEQYLWECVAV